MSLSHIRKFDYMHNFGTGWQTLVFSSHDKAREFAKSNHLTFNPPRGRRHVQQAPKES